MNIQLEEIREQQKASWNQFSGGWKKWDRFNMEFLQLMGDAIIRQLNIREDDVVLDIASGTGEPAITIASLAKKGKIIATDLSEQMLEIAKENAVKKGTTNLQTQVADACALPFQNDLFSKVSCRMGFMFFPDMQLAANEMYRVLKGGGKMATAVWALPQDNPWVTTIMSVIGKNINMPQSPPQAPGMFRCSQPGFMKEILQKAGFKNVEQNIVNGKADYDNAGNYWQMMNEVAAPVVGALSKADEATIAKIKKEVFEKCEQQATDGHLNLAYSAYILSAEK